MKTLTATRTRALLGAAAVAALLFTAPSATQAQQAPASTPAGAQPMPRELNVSTKTFYLANSIQGNTSSEILVAMRNMLDPHVKIYLVESQNAIVVQAAPDQLQLVQKLLNDLDRPRKSYRLTYTLTEFDAGKRVGTQHYSMVVVSSERTTLKQGSKIPVVTSATASGSAPKTDVQYLDIGMNFSAALDEFANGVRLRSKVEQSGVAEQVSVLGAQDPVVRQSVLEGTAFITSGKPVILGSLDVSGTTRRIDIEVVMEPVP